MRNRCWLYSVLLGVEREELEDWNCCGATTYISYGELQSYAVWMPATFLLPSRWPRPDGTCAPVSGSEQDAALVREYPWIAKLSICADAITFEGHWCPRFGTLSTSYSMMRSRGAEKPSR